MALVVFIKRLRYSALSLSNRRPAIKAVACVRVRVLYQKEQNLMKEIGCGWMTVLVCLIVVACGG